MSANYIYPGQAYQHTLTPLKGWYEEGALDAECVPTANVNIGSAGNPINSGTVVHATAMIANSDPYGGVVSGPGVMAVEMGCAVNQGIPIFLWPGSTDPDISNPGVPPGTSPAGDSTYGPPDGISVFPMLSGQGMPGLVATGGYEVETTEYDRAQTYASGQYLRAVNSNTDVNAGAVTNQRATSAGFTSTGLVIAFTDTIVGVVSRGTYTNANRKPGLALWTYYLPGTR